MGCTTSKQARRELRGCLSMPRRRSSFADTSFRHLLLKDYSTITSAASSSADNSYKTTISDEGMKKMNNDLRLVKPPLSSAPSTTTTTTAMTKNSRRTPSVTPPNETDIINAWELMEGLEDITPLRPTTSSGDNNNSHQRSFSFDCPREIDHILDNLGGRDDYQVKEKKKQSILVPAFRRPFHFRCSPARQKSPDLTGLVRARVKVFQDRIDARRKPGRSRALQEVPAAGRWPPRGERRVVLYSTSLRGIRETFEDCFYVRTVLQGHGLRIDERDLSMHPEFKDELEELISDGEEELRKQRRLLPEVFANGRHIGGVDDVRRMHEAGELEAALEGCEKVSEEGGGGGVCEACGGGRFVVCLTCSGSCKVLVDDCRRDEDAGGNGSGGDDRVGFEKCGECNEYGIVKCPLCW